jgi:hypothetical protein
MPIANSREHQARGKFGSRRQSSDDDRRLTRRRRDRGFAFLGQIRSFVVANGEQVDRRRLHPRPSDGTGSIACPAGDHSGAVSSQQLRSGGINSEQIVGCASLP